MAPIDIITVLFRRLTQEDVVNSSPSILNPIFPTTFVSVGSIFIVVVVIIVDEMVDCCVSIITKVCNDQCSTLLL